jgi:hypothetical protein
MVYGTMMHKRGVSHWDPKLRAHHVAKVLYKVWNDPKVRAQQCVFLTTSSSALAAFQLQSWSRAAWTYSGAEPAHPRCHHSIVCTGSIVPPSRSGVYYLMLQLSPIRGILTWQEELRTVRSSSLHSVVTAPIPLCLLQRAAIEASSLQAC